jgi:methionine-rich copper-binding protein CopC
MEIDMRSGLIAALIASLALGAAAPALAHTVMTKTNIAENAKLAAAPPEFTATFQHETSMAAVKLENASGQQVQLDYKPTPARSKTFKVALPRLAPGKYTLSWRAVAKDGHAMPGAVHFSITG